MAKKYLAATLPNGEVATRITDNNYTHISALLSNNTWGVYGFHTSAELAAKNLKTVISRANKWIANGYDNADYVIQETQVIAVYEIDHATFKSLQNSQVA
jgi:hypothetical protein